jgi:hypothetical protein
MSLEAGSMTKAQEMKLPIHKRPSVRKMIREAIAVMKLNGNWQFYEQSTWGRTSPLNPCETECCLAGWMDFLHDPQKHNKCPLGSASRVYRELGESEGEIRLFDSAGCWPDPFNYDYFSAVGIERVLVLERRAEYWLKTGE